MFSSMFWHVLAESILLVARAKTSSKILLLFARLVCASHIFNKRKHVRACFSKSAFAKSSFARLVCARPYTWIFYVPSCIQLSALSLWEKMVTTDWIQSHVGQTAGTQDACFTSCGGGRLLLLACCLPADWFDVGSVEWVKLIRIFPYNAGVKHDPWQPCYIELLLYYFYDISTD